MSLSFVSKAIQTTTEDGTFEEKPVENPEDETAGASMTGSGQNLYDQLRKNKEDADAEREEFQRSIMRGTLALDDDDAAHLEQLNKKRLEQRARTQQQTAAELAAFRAARADRQHNNNPQEQQQKQDTSEKSFDVQAFAKEGSTAELSSEKKLVPTFIKKKRKRIGDEATTSAKIEPSNKSNKPGEQDESFDAKQSASEDIEKKNEQGQGISSLLAGYSSSSDDEENDDE